MKPAAHGDTHTCQPSARPALAHGRGRAALWVFLLVLGAYLITAKGFWDLNDAEAYFLVTKALVERGEVYVRPELVEPSDTLYFTGPDGRLYTHFGLGISLFSAPLFLAGKCAGSIIAALAPSMSRLANLAPRVAVALGCALAAALAVVALMWLLQLLELPVPTAVAAALVYAFGTYMWPYSKIGFYDVHLTLSLTLAVCCVIAWRRHGASSWLWLSGTALGWGIATRPALVLALPPLVGYIAWAAWKRMAETNATRGRAIGSSIAALVVYALALIPWAVLVLSYNAARTGALLDFGYTAADFVPSKENSQFLVACYGNTVSPGRGFFVYSPVAVLMFWGLGEFWRRHRAESVAVWSIAALTFAFYCARPGWDTVWPWGPRYLLVLTPLVMIPVAYALRRLWRTPRGRRAIIALIALSVAVQLVAIVVPYGTFLHHVRAVTGTCRTAALDPRYWPIMGQFWTLARISFDRVPLSALTGGIVPNDVKMNLRRSLDFWFVYAHRLGLPWPLWASILALLTLATAACARNLARSLRG